MTLDQLLDRTLINLVTILISGTGLFAAITKFNVPELRQEFIAQNPFAVKANAIDSVSTWAFTVLAMAGLLVQAVSLISHYPAADRLHSWRCYAALFLIGLVIMGAVVYSLTAVTRCVARTIWMPEVVAGQQGLFERSVFVIEHDGFAKQDLEYYDGMSAEEREALEHRKPANWRMVDSDFSQIEELLDLPHDLSDRTERMKRLAAYFEKQGQKHSRE